MEVMALPGIDLGTCYRRPGRFNGKEVEWDVGPRIFLEDGVSVDSDLDEIPDLGLSRKAIQSGRQSLPDMSRSRPRDVEADDDRLSLVVRGARVVERKLQDGHKVRIHLLVRRATMFGVQYYATDTAGAGGENAKSPNSRLLARFEILPLEGPKSMFVLRPALEEMKSYQRASFGSDSIRAKVKTALFQPNLFRGNGTGFSHSRGRKGSSKSFTKNCGS